MIDPTPPDLEELFGQERELAPVEEPVRLRIESRLAGTLGVAAAGSALRPPAAWRGWLWKIGLATIGGLVVTGIVASRRGSDAASEPVVSEAVVSPARKQDERPAVLASAPTTLEPSGTSLDIRDLPDVPQLAAGPRKSVTPSAAASEPSTDEALRRERELTDAAQTALARGEWAAALRTLDLASAEFPNGRLQQEREALAIRSLWVSGARGRARERAASFRERFPKSPLLHALEETFAPEPAAAP